MSARCNLCDKFLDQYEGIGIWNVPGKDRITYCKSCAIQRNRENSLENYRFIWYRNPDYVFEHDLSKRHYAKYYKYVVCLACGRQFKRRYGSLTCTRCGFECKIDKPFGFFYAKKKHLENLKKKFEDEEFARKYPGEVELPLP